MSEMDSDPLVGQKLGQYEILALIGKGGMASVYQARQAAINRIVAIKVLPRILVHDETFMQRFHREAEVIARLEHFHILPVYDYGEHDMMPYIVMRYLSGGTVQDRIRYENLEWADIVRITNQVADALDYAHARNVIHRDVKPSNILLDDQGNAYISDFGIAKIQEGTVNLTGSGIVGTPAYMAPELSEGIAAGPAVDVYSLGVTLFEMITGTAPYKADTPIVQILMHMNDPIPSLLDYDPGISPKVDAVVGRAMAKQPDDRFRSPGDLASALEQAVRASGGWDADASGRPRASTTVVRAAAQPDAQTLDRPVSVSSPTPLPAAPAGSPSARVKPRRRTPVLLWILFGVLSLTLVGAGVVLYRLLAGSGISSLEMTATAQAARVGEVVVSVTDTPLPDTTDTPSAVVIDQAPTVPSAPTEAPQTAAVEPASGATPTMLPPTVYKRGVLMVLVPEGTFTMGRNEGYANERPEHEVYLDAFYIDETEVTNQDYMACVDSTDANSCEERALDEVASKSRYLYYGAEAYKDYPVFLVTWYQAQTYCEWRGGHLPIEAQWEKAARWNPETGENYLFPWGLDVLDSYYLNYNSNFGDTTQVKYYPAGVSSVGAYDMAGNVAEWVYDWYQDNYYELSPGENPTGPEGGEFKVIRGGNFESPGSQLTTPFREILKPDTKLQTLGFRCAWTPSGDPTGP